MIKSLLFLLVSLIICYTIYNFKEKGILLLIYVPNKYYLTSNVIFVGQLIFATASIIIVIGFDCLFLYMCVKLVIQLKLMTHRIENISKYENPDRELNKCVKHHVMLIE